MDTKQFLLHFKDFAIQLFDDADVAKDKKDKSLTVYGKPSDFTKEQLKELNDKGAGIYFTPNQFPTGKRSKALCAGVNAWYVECDELTIDEQWKNLKASPLQPSFVVQSKKSLHAYWLAKSGTIENCEIILKGLVRHFQGDSSCAEISRVLRIPGFYHKKDRNNPVLVGLVEEHPENKYDDLDMLFAFPCELEQPKPLQKLAKVEKTEDFWTMLGSLDNKDVLVRLSGQPIVNGEVFTFSKRNPSGEYIDVNGKSADAWLDEAGMIGSGKRGGPSWLQWVGYYGRDKKEIAKWAKDNLIEVVQWEREHTPESVAVQKTEEKKKDFKFLTFTEVVELGYQELIKTQPEMVISYGYSWLDDKLVGIFPSELNVLGGESGTGKTALATNIIYRASKKVKCGVYALEDRLPDYGIKALFYEVNRIKKANEGTGAKGYWWNDYRLNRIKDSSFQTYLLKAKKNLENGNIFFAKVEEMMNIDLLESLILEQVKNGVKLFLVDHLHYFDLSSGTDSKSDYVEKIMVRLKALLNNTGASMLLVVHYKKLEGKKPSIDSFKDSIAIPQNANYVINLWRERSSDKSEEIEQLGVNLMPVQKKNITHFMIPKVRNPNGEGTFKAVWNPEKGDYEDEKREWQSGTDLQAIAKSFGGEITNLPNF